MKTSFPVCDLSFLRPFEVVRCPRDRPTFFIRDLIAIVIINDKAKKGNELSQKADQESDRKNAEKRMEIEKTLLVKYHQASQQIVD